MWVTAENTATPIIYEGVNESVEALAIKRLQKAWRKKLVVKRDATRLHHDIPTVRENISRLRTVHLHVTFAVMVQNFI